MTSSENHFQDDSDSSLQPRPMGLFLDTATGTIHLRWPRDLMTVPFAVVSIQMVSEEWVVSEGLMAVFHDDENRHLVGRLNCAEMGLTPFLAEGLRPEATVVRDLDAPLPSIDSIERALRSIPEDRRDARRRLRRLLNATLRRLP